MRHIGRDRRIHYIIDEYGVDVLIGPIDSRMMSFAASAGKSILEMVVVGNPLINCAGYPIDTIPLGYLDFNGRPFGLCGIARAHQDSVLLKVQTACEATFGPRLPATTSGCRSLAEFGTHQIVPFLFGSFVCVHSLLEISSSYSLSASCLVLLHSDDWQSAYSTPDSLLRILSKLIELGLVSFPSPLKNPSRNITTPTHLASPASMSHPATQPASVS